MNRDAPSPGAVLVRGIAIGVDKRWRDQDSVAALMAISALVLQQRALASSQLEDRAELTTAGREPGRNLG